MTSSIKFAFHYLREIACIQLKDTALLIIKSSNLH